MINVWGIPNYGNKKKIMNSGWEKQQQWNKDQGVLCKTATDLHSEGEMAGFGVPDDAGVHGRLSSPAPL